MKPRQTFRTLLENFAPLLPTHTFYGRTGAYLSKYTLLNFGKDRLRLHLHRFHRSDEDPELHNHPWAWAWSLILVGGYFDQRTHVGDGPSTIARQPGDFVLIEKSTFHRVDLIDNECECWTLFLSGPVTGSWGFFDRFGAFTPWRKFLKAHGLTPVSSVEGRGRKS